MIGINSVTDSVARPYRFAPARRCDQLPRLVFRRFLVAELVLQLQTRERLRKSSAAARSARHGRECARMRTRTGVCGDV